MDNFCSQKMTSPVVGFQTLLASMTENNGHILQPKNDMAGGWITYITLLASMTIFPTRGFPTNSPAPLLRTNIPQTALVATLDTYDLISCNFFKVVYFKMILFVLY
jgi:hypothetical protein